MAERIGRERIVREPGYLYFLGKDGYLWRVPTRLNPSGSKARVGSERYQRIDGYTYFLDKAGYLSRARMKSVGQAPPGRQLPGGGGPRSGPPTPASKPHWWSRTSPTPPPQQGTGPRRPPAPASWDSSRVTRSFISPEVAPVPRIPAFPRAEVIGGSPVRRETGYIYHFDSDGFLWKTPTLGNRGRQAERVGRESLVREEGYVYFLDRSGFVARAPATASRRGGRGPTATALGSTPTPEPQQRAAPAVRFCPRCGTARGADHVFCGTCGLDLRTPPARRS